MTDNSTWASSDEGVTWQERGNITNLTLSDVTLNPGDTMPNNSWSTISSGSVTVSSREMNSFSSQDITYGNGKYLSVGNINLQGYMSGSGQENDNGTINSFNYSNQSYSEWGYRVLSSTDNGNSWQLLDNASFNNPRGITAYH